VAVAKTPVKAKAKKAPLPEWKTPEAEALMKKRTATFLAKHGTSEVIADLQVLLALSTKLTGYRRPCQLISAYKAPEPEPEEEEEDEEAEDEESEDEESEEEEEDEE
jgi:ABC-type Zn2+ transport system substrate-binding protein/surface adhesin